MSRLLVPATLFCALFVATFAMAQNFQPRQSSEAFGHLGKQSVSVEPSSEQTEKSKIVQASMVPASEYVAVMGQVTRPGVYEFRNGISNLEGLIRHAGELTRFASREFYVIGRDRPLTRIEPSQHRDFQFYDGDILIVETPAHYYSKLNEPGAQQLLRDLHPKTQIALVNIAERPIVLNLSPQNAHLPAILAQLNQPDSAMIGVDLKLPPNAKLIPPNAQLAPSLILSGSILIFDPVHLQHDRLPVFPNAIVTDVPSDLRTVSAESSAPLLTKNATMQFDLSNARANPDWSLPNLDASSLPAGTANVNLSESVNGTSESASNRDDLAQNQLPEITALTTSPLTDDTSAESSGLLSSRQWKYVIVFCVLIVMFAGAVIVRRHQEGHDYRNLFGLAASGYSSALSTSESLTPGKSSNTIDDFNSTPRQAAGIFSESNNLVEEAEFLATLPQSVLDDPMLQAIFPSQTSATDRENEKLATFGKQTFTEKLTAKSETDEINRESEQTDHEVVEPELKPLFSNTTKEEEPANEVEDGDLPRYQPVAEVAEPLAALSTQETDEPADLASSLTIGEPDEEVVEEDDFAAGIMLESDDTELDNLEASYEHDVILPPLEPESMSSEPTESAPLSAIPRPKMIDLPQTEEKSLLSRVLRAIEREREANAND